MRARTFRYPPLRHRPQPPDVRPQNLSREWFSNIRAVSKFPARPADGVIATAVIEDHIDLHVMGAYGHSPIRQFILGSTTTSMVRTCHIPVLMFR